MTEMPDEVGRGTQWLQRYGYLHKDELQPSAQSMRSAWARMQHFFGLRVSGETDQQSLLVTRQSRCGLPDVLPAHITIACNWPIGEMTYTYESTTSHLPASDVRRLVRAAWDTWAAVVPIVFREVRPTTPAPDVQIAWRPAVDPDFSMVGVTVAHADFPLGCSIVVNQLPLPMHFDESECIWKDGAVEGAFDVQTVALHEIGHLLGLQHLPSPEAVMAPGIAPNSTKRTLTQFDLDAISALYG